MTFYNKLTEGHIGITGWKLFYINKLTTKTVNRTYYIAILLTQDQN